MTDSIWKDVYDELNGGSWTTKPGLCMVTDTDIGNLLDVAIKNKSNNACVVILPAEPIEASYNEGIKSKTYHFPIAVFYFPSTKGTDTGQYELQIIMSDIETILAASTFQDDIYLDDEYNKTNRKHAKADNASLRHLFLASTIIVEDWIV